MTARRTVAPLVAAVKRDLAALARRDADAAKSSAAALCLKLAQEIEDSYSEAPLAARVSAGKLLAETMATLLDAAPAAEKVDRLDELTARRASRKASA